MRSERGEASVVQPNFQPGDRFYVEDPKFLPGSATVIKEIEVARLPRNLRERIQTFLAGSTMTETLVQVRFDDFDGECSVQNVHPQYLTPLPLEGQD